MDMDGPPHGANAAATATVAVAVDAPVDDEGAENEEEVVGSPDDASPASPADPEAGAEAEGDAPAAGTTTPPPEPEPEPERPAATTTAAASIPEPPRWRFPAVAKKSLGYNSAHAGSHVRGLTSDELGARYVAPEISLDELAREREDVRRSDPEPPSDEAFSKEDVEVGRLGGGVPPPDAFRAEGRSVGRLDVEGAASGEAASPAGTFAGLPRAGSTTEESRKPYREWETRVDVTPKPERKAGEWYDGDVEDGYRMPGGEGRGSASREVGRIELRRPGEARESFAGEVGKGKRALGDGAATSDVVGDGGDAREGVLLFTSASADATEKDSQGTEKDSQGTAASTIEDEEMKKKRRCLYLMLLVPLLLGAVLGAVLGRDSEQEKVVVAGAMGAIPPIVNETSAPSTLPSASPVSQESLQPSIQQSSPPSIQQSSQPSLFPSAECPEGTAALSVERPRRSDALPWGRGEGSIGFTWRIRDACSGEVVGRCLPCAAGGFQSEARNRRGPSGQSGLGGSGEDAGCLPVDGDYVLEVGPEGGPGECCDFDPASAAFSHGDVAIEVPRASELTHLDAEATTTTTYFGAGTAPCPSPSPSAAPSCAARDRDFDLCVAVDMSGSVCNDGGGSECQNCRAEFLPSLFRSPCRDDGVDEDTCCDNFSRVKEFASLVVRSLGDSPVAERTFAVVEFSTEARAVGGPSLSAEAAAAVVEGLDYAGGLTNHRGAIEACRGSLLRDRSRKHFIMLVTDGMASVPGTDPSGEAEDAARAARADGTFIIPVFISPYNDWSALMFMRRLSSDGKVFDVTDFSSLNGLQDQLIDQVSCS